MIDMTDEDRSREAVLLLRSGQGRAYRVLAGHTLQTLAPMVGVAFGTLARWERGVTRPSVADAARYHRVITGLEADLLSRFEGTSVADDTPPPLTDEDAPPDEDDGGPA